MPDQDDHNNPVPGDDNDVQEVPPPTPPRQSDIYVRAGAKIARFHDLFANFFEAVDTGINPTESELTDTEYDRNLTTFSALALSIPNLGAKLHSYVHTPEKVHTITKSLTKGHADARGNVNKTLKDPILHYAAKALGVLTLDPPIDPAKNKEETRGMHHPMLGFLLVPASHVHIYQGNPAAYRNAVLAGRVTLPTSVPPLFMYEGHRVDQDDVSLGFCRGALPIMVGRHLLTGPASALNNRPGYKRTLRMPQAELNGIKKVTGRHVAIACTLAYHALSAADDWRIDTHGFEKEGFFLKIVRLFETNPKSQWVVETLDFWTHHIFGDKADEAGEDANEPDFFAIVIEQQAALEEQDDDEDAENGTVLVPATPDVANTADTIETPANAHASFESGAPATATQSTHQAGAIGSTDEPVDDDDASAHNAALDLEHQLAAAAVVPQDNAPDASASHARSASPPPPVSTSSATQVRAAQREAPASSSTSTRRVSRRRAAEDDEPSERPRRRRQADNTAASSTAGPSLPPSPSPRRPRPTPKGKKTARRT